MTPPPTFCTYAPQHRLPSRRLRTSPVCSRAPHTPSNQSPDAPAASTARPLAPRQTTTLLTRMLQIAVSNEDYALAASLRDARLDLLQRDPVYRLQCALDAAVEKQNFAECSRLRDRLELETVLSSAESHKPKFPMGLVVLHKRLGHRMLLFGADHCCRKPRRKAEKAAMLFMQRGEQQPWYHAAVDERDKAVGDNIVYVAEDDCVPAPPGVQIQHPITRIMFEGIYEPEICPGLSCYIPSSSTIDD